MPTSLLGVPRTAPGRNRTGSALGLNGRTQHEAAGALRAAAMQRVQTVNPADHETSFGQYCSLNVINKFGLMRT